jgi:hypothetical protein
MDLPAKAQLEIPMLRLFCIQNNRKEAHMGGLRG